MVHCSFSPPQNKRFYLFGYPISQSKAPALHNAWFQSWPALRDEVGAGNTYELWEANEVTSEMLGTLNSEECGGAAITMPLKASILPFLDEVSPESRVTGACNTIVKVPVCPTLGASQKFKLVGTNTDILGVRNALLGALSSQHPFLRSLNIISKLKFPPNCSALLIGGGATTRSAAYALASLGLQTLYIINRDAVEVENLIHSMKDKEGMHDVQFVWLGVVDDVRRILGSDVHGGSSRLILGVGVIPSAPPSTPAECTVYEIAEAVFSQPFAHLSKSGINGEMQHGPDEISFLPLPSTRLFLDMCYTPTPQTPMLTLASSFGWHTIDGVVATTEQGKAQQRMWFCGSVNYGKLDGHLKLD